MKNIINFLNLKKGFKFHRCSNEQTKLLPPPFFCNISKSRSQGSGDLADMGSQVGGGMQPRPEAIVGKEISRNHHFLTAIHESTFRITHNMNINSACAMGIHMWNCSPSAVNVKNP